MALDKHRRLDDALRSPGEADSEVAELVDVADRVREVFAVDPSDAARQRAMFMAAAATRAPRPTTARFAIPALAVTAVLLFAGVLGRGSLPGDFFYPFRAALASTGLVSSPAEEVDRRIASARSALTRAEEAESTGVAQRLAFSAIAQLARATGIATHLDGASRAAEIRALEERAAEVIAEANEDAGGQGLGRGRGRGRGGDETEGEDSGRGRGRGRGRGQGGDDTSGSSGRSGDDSSGTNGGSSGPGPDGEG